MRTVIRIVGALLLIAALGCSSCLRPASHSPREALAQLLYYCTHVDDPMKLLESRPKLSYSLREPALLLSGDRAAVLVLAPNTRVTMQLFHDDRDAELSISDDSSRFPGLDGSAIELSNELMAAAREHRLRVARGRRIAVLFVTTEMAESLKGSTRVFVCERSVLSEKQLHEKYGEAPRMQYSVRFSSAGEWVVTEEGDGQQRVFSDEEMDEYIAENGPPWKYTRLELPHWSDLPGGPFYIVTVYGINHEVVAPSTVITRNPDEVVGVFMLPRSKGATYFGKQKSANVLKTLLPLAPDSTGGEDAVQQLLPGTAENESLWSFARDSALISL